MAEDLLLSIPPSLQPHLRPCSPLDTRPNAEILAALANPPPITSEKNIWCFWDSGLAALPSWCKRNLIAWHRINGPEWSVRLLDAVPGSPGYFLNFVDEELLPEVLVKGGMKGKHVGPHSADLLRAATVWKYGGVWMDVGCILTRRIDRFCWDLLESDKNEYEICVFWVDGPTIANHFVAGRKGAEFLLKWQNLFTHLWTSTRENLASSPLLAFRAEEPPSKAAQRGFNFPFAVGIQEIMEYTAQISCWRRVAQLREPNGGFDGKSYWQNKILKYDVLPECWAAETEIGFVGQDFFDLLSTRRDADPTTEKYKQAEKVTWRLLSITCMQKVTHGKGLLKSPALGTLWDLAENEGKDIEEGTFAELLRYGSVNFEQVRKEVERVEVEDTGFVIEKGLLEA